MKFFKMLGLLSMAAAALMVFSGIASATTLTSPDKTALGVGAKLHAVNENGHVTLTGPLGIAVECATSTVEGEITNAGGSGVAVAGKITSLSFTGCTNGYVVDVNALGTLSVASSGTNTGTVTSNGTEVTVTNVPFAGTCVYKTSNTDIGTLTGSTKTGATATFDISASIPRTGGSGLCGSSGTWEGSYSIDKPDSLDIDA